MRMTKTLAAALLAASAMFALPGSAGAQVTLKAVMHSDVKIVDPIWTTAYITRNHGYMVYDTLFAMDEKGEIKPQMVDKYDVSRRQAHLHLHAARWPRLARRRAGHGGGLRRLDQALGRQGFARPEGDELRRHDHGGRREDLHGQAQGADRPPHLRARQALLERAVHDAEARRRNRSEHADFRFHRLRPVRVQARRMEGGRQGGLRQVRQVQAALRAGLRACGRQGGQGRPRRVARDLRPAAGDQCAARGRDRLHRVALARSAAAGEGGQERQAGRTGTRSATSTRSAPTTCIRRSTIRRSARRSGTPSIRRTSCRR